MPEWPDSLKLPHLLIIRGRTQRRTELYLLDVFIHSTVTTQKLNLLATSLRTYLKINCHGYNFIFMIRRKKEHLERQKWD